MVENTTIEWTDHTFNPWEGCQKVGPGCDHCYAEARNARYSSDGKPPNWGPGAPRRRTSESNWRQPLKWARRAEAFDREHQRRQRVFCASLSDVFDNAVDRHWRRDLFDLIAETPELDWLLLTKRIGNVRRMIEEIGYPKLPDHVWLGATIVNQQEADRDIPKLLGLPAAVRFLSMEPLLGSVDPRSLPVPDDPSVICTDIRLDALTGFHTGTVPEDIGLNKRSLPDRLDGVDWVIAGGESGKGARAMNPAWVRALRDQCEMAGTAFLFKQWGEWAPAESQPLLVRERGQTLYVDHAGKSHMAAGQGRAPMVRVGKKHAGRVLDGRTWDGVPRR